jgi:peptide/nickel transport system permease protein
VTAYIVRRLLQTVVMLFILSIVFFLLVRYTPTSACYQQLGCQELMKLDEPITAQYVSYLSNLIHANFGFSTSGTPVSTLILQALPATLVLVSVSLTLQQLIALPLGMLAAIRQYSRFDQILTFVSYLFLSMPALVLGNLLVVIVAQKLEWFPAGHSTDLALPPIGSADWLAALRQDPGYILGDTVRHLVLPAFVLASGGIAIDSRFMRGAMLQVLQQDYIRTARAKGVPRRLIIFKHAFRNALLPIITNLGLYLPALVGGVIVVEEAFSYEGIGTFFLNASDFPVMQAMLFFSSIVVLLANLLADIGYAILDPRIRYDTGAGA